VTTEPLIAVVHDLPSVVLRAGERTTFAFPSPLNFGGKFLPYRCKRIEPCEGLVVERVAIGKIPKFPTFEFGAPEIAHQDFADKRVLPDERLWFYVRNASNDDLYVRGKVVFESAPVAGMPLSEPRTFESDEDAVIEFADHLKTVVRRRKIATKE